MQPVLNGYRAAIHIKGSAVPRRIKSRSVANIQPYLNSNSVAIGAKLALAKINRGASMMDKFARNVTWVIALTALPYVANAQGTTNLPVTYCGVGVQGALDEYTMANPYSGQFYRNEQFRTALAKTLFAAIPAETWKMDLNRSGEGTGAGRGLALSHVITYEKADQQSFIDPVDKKTYYNTSYAVGINTILFDLGSKQVRALVPAILRSNTTTPAPQTKIVQQQAFDAMLSNAAADAPLGQWMASIQGLPLRWDDQVTFQVLPVSFSDAAQQRLLSQQVFDANGASDFSRRATILTEALVALQFAKPLVPAQAGPSPSDTSGSEPANQYVATIPECLGQSAATFEARPPAYQLRVIVDDLKTADFSHELPGVDGGGTTQKEIGFGGRFRAQVLSFATQGGGTVLDDRTFGYAKSLRFLGEVKLNASEEYLKLTTSFVKELLAAYASQDRKWVKEHMSAAIVDKKQRDPSQVSKQWKDLFSKKLGIAAAK